MKLSITQHAFVATFLTEIYGNRTEIKKAGLNYIYALNESMHFIALNFIERRYAQ
jgi:hypothetical protein